MTHEELYNQAINGNSEALEILVEEAEMGEADAQYLLSCFYETDGPLKNEAQADYWLDMASYNGNQQAKQKLKEKPSQQRKYVYEEEPTLSNLNNKEKEEEPRLEETKKSNSNLWLWFLFLILFTASYIYKCEKHKMSDEEFNRFMKSIKHDDEVLNPSDHIQMDSNLNIKADNEYIEWLEKKAHSTNK